MVKAKNGCKSKSFIREKGLFVRKIIHLVRKSFIGLKIFLSKIAFSKSGLCAFSKNFAPIFFHCYYQGLIVKYNVLIFVCCGAVVTGYPPLF